MLTIMQKEMLEFNIGLSIIFTLLSFLLLRRKSKKQKIIAIAYETLLLAWYAVFCFYLSLESMYGCRKYGLCDQARAFLYRAANYEIADGVKLPEFELIKCIHSYDAFLHGDHIDYLTIEFKEPIDNWQNLGGDYSKQYSSHCYDVLCIKFFDEGKRAKISTGHTF